MMNNGFKKYVLGFLFTTDRQSVWLIRKTKPEWQKGKLNGIGGKLEDGELPLNAMRREFKEEGGIDIQDWKQFCNLTDDRTYEVICYYSFSDKEPITMTDEEIFRCMRHHLPIDVLPNLRWLIPMAL